MPEKMLEETTGLQLVNGKDKEEKRWTIYN